MVRKNIIVMVIALLMITGCSQSEQAAKEPSSKSESLTSSSTQSESTSSTTSKQEGGDTEVVTGTDELGLPKMTPENQAYHDKYLKPFYPAHPLFWYSFDETKFEYVHPARIYSCLAKSTELKEVPQDEVEELIAQWFPMTAEQARELSSIREYSVEKGVYTTMSIEGIETDDLCGVVTNSSLEGDVLTLTCDWYTTTYPGQADSYENTATAITRIRLDSDEKWFYLSNQSSKEFKK